MGPPCRGRVLQPMLLTCAALAACRTLPCGGGEARDVNALTAQQILERVAQVCAQCKTYRDTGCVTTVFVRGDGSRTDKKPFSTAFVRPDRYRFEFTSQMPGMGKRYRYIVHMDANGVRTWWDVRPGVKKGSSLMMAVAAATGVSGCSALTVPRLLMPGQITGGSLAYLDEPSRLQDGKLDGIECLRIKGEAVRGSPMTVWLDKTTLLVRRIDTSHQFPTFRTETTTTYSPAIDVEIDPEELAFDPPGN